MGCGSDTSARSKPYPPAHNTACCPPSPCPGTSPRCILPTLHTSVDLPVEVGWCGLKGYGAALHELGVVTPQFEYHCLMARLGKNIPGLTGTTGGSGACCSTREPSLPLTGLPQTKFQPTAPAQKSGCSGFCGDGPQK